MHINYEFYLQEYAYPCNHCVFGRARADNPLERNALDVLLDPPVLKRNPHTGLKLPRLAHPALPARRLLGFLPVSIHILRRKPVGHFHIALQLLERGEHRALAAHTVVEHLHLRKLVEAVVQTAPRRAGHSELDVVKGEVHDGLSVVAHHAAASVRGQALEHALTRLA